MTLCTPEPNRNPDWDETTENACFRFEWVPSELSIGAPCETPPQPPTNRSDER